MKTLVSMIAIDIKTTDGVDINGYVVDQKSSTSKKGVSFIHKQGGDCFIPHEEIENVKYGTTPTKVKIEPPNMEDSPNVVIKGSKMKNNQGTKFNQCVEILKPIWQQYSRKECIDQLVEKVGMTPAGASTYYYNAKKHLQENLEG